MTDEVNDATCEERRGHIIEAFKGATKGIERSVNELKIDFATFAEKTEATVQRMEDKTGGVEKEQAKFDQWKETHEDIDHGPAARPCEELKEHKTRHFMLTLAVVGSVLSALVALGIAALVGLAKLGVFR